MPNTLFQCLFFLCILVTNVINICFSKKTNVSDSSQIACRCGTLKGVVDCFFLGLIVFMGCSLTYVNASFLKNALFFT